MIAAISGNDLVNLVVWLIVAGLIFFLVSWLIDYAKVPEPFNRVIKVIVAVVAVLILVNALLTLIGHPMVRIG